MPRELIKRLRALRGSSLAEVARRVALGNGRIAAGEPDADFVMTLYETLLGRGASTREFAEWRDRLAGGGLGRAKALRTFYEGRAGEAAGEAERGQHPYPIMGTTLRVRGLDWRERAADSRRLGRPVRFQSRFPAPIADGQPIASVITSLYKGGAYINRFLEMMTTQTIFPHCELIIINANSPEAEADTIDAYRARFPQIVHVRLPYTATIYAAWNLGARIARGRYLTNANVDDLRRPDSLELQAATLDALDFVDVVYQDFVYTFEDGMAFDQIAELDLRSDLPVATRLSLATYNPPHNAPMWRRSLHEKVGYFDDCMRSGGDWDFWMRCMMKGQQFFKLNDPHVAYYVNPKGVSTAANGAGAREVREVHRRHWRDLMPPAIVEDHSAFVVRCGLPPETPEQPTGRRFAMVQKLLREAALKAEKPRAPGIVSQRRPRLLIDGVGFQRGTNTIGVWREIIAGLVEHADVVVLDRGNMPAMASVMGIPFPSYREREAAADSLLVERFSRLVTADLFISTGPTTPTRTPSIAFVSAADCPTAEEPERELSILYARHRVCGDVEMRERLSRGLEATCVSVFPWERDPKGAVRHLVEVFGEVDARGGKGIDATFFERWAELRAIQADVDFR